MADVLINRNDMSPMNNNVSALADRITRNREIAGLHYPSDSDAGKDLASQIHRLLGQPLPQLREGQAQSGKDMVPTGPRRRTLGVGVELMPQRQSKDEASVVERSLITELEKRFHAFRLPPHPKSYDPTKVDADKLRKFGIPPRPDKAHQPRLHDLWMTTFGQKLHFVAFKLPTVHMLEAEGFRPFFRRDRARAVATQFEASRNWSGAYIEPSAGRKFVQVWGQWTVPTPKLPPGATLPTSGQTDYHCATWIGLDGERLYRNSSLPQIGTDQKVTVTADGTQKVEAKAWTQWWVRYDNASVPVPIALPVAPGDRISCALTVLTDHCVWFSIVNQSTIPPTFIPIAVDAPTVSVGGTDLQLSVSGATAEWIMERPAVPVTDATRKKCATPKLDDLQAFADYDSMDFVGCCAAEAGEGHASAIWRTLKSPRFVRMYEMRSGPQRTGYISMPTRIDDTSFRMSYGDFR